MAYKKKPRDRETQERITELEAEAPPDPIVHVDQEAKPDKMGAARKSISVKLAEARLRRLTAQNKQLQYEYRTKAGAYVLLEDIKREVLAANVSVKNQVFAVIERADLPRESKLALRREMAQALNDLAYERTRETSAA